MHTHSLPFRQAALQILCALLLMPASVSAQAADTGPTLYLRPHCENPTEDPCETFDVKDPLTLTTEPLKIGDILDMDLVVENPDGQAVTRVRSWLTYDPTVLEGTLIQLDEFLPDSTPGEADFSEAEGYLKLDANGSEENPVYDEEFVVARIQFTVKGLPPLAGTVIGFYDVQRGGHTMITSEADGPSLLKKEPGMLFVAFDGATPPPTVAEDDDNADADESSSSSVVTATGSSSSSIASAGPAVPPTDVPTEPTRTAFTLLQVQRLGVSTEGSSAFLAWDPLQSSQLKGYNVYYGTISGQYIQRRTIQADNSSITIRALPEGVQYYFAVRAINQSDIESAFSQEVGVKVGDVGSSTAPLMPGTGQGTFQGNVIKNGTVPGETGSPSVLLFLFLASALIGTRYAWKRQLSIALPTKQ